MVEHRQISSERFKGGQKLHIKLQETVFHPGHYRIALAVNSRAELPPDPEVTTKEGTRGPSSVSAVIQQTPSIPVLMDGLFVHTMKPADPFETDVPLPNISCPKCTLQIIEFMAEHGLNKDGGYFYHHCADLQITADPSKPIDKGWRTMKSGRASGGINRSLKDPPGRAVTPTSKEEGI